MNPRRTLCARTRRASRAALVPLLAVLLFLVASASAFTPHERVYPGRTTQFAPTEEYFVQLVETVGMPALILAGSSFTIGLAFVIIRYCFNACGGRYPTESGYKPHEQALPRILVFIFSVLLAVSISNAILSNQFFSDGIRDFLDEIINALNKITAKIAHIAANLKRANMVENKGVDFVTQLSSVSESIRTGALQAQDQVNGYATLRQALLLLIYDLCLISVAIGVASALFRSNRAAVAVVFLSVLVSLVIWLSYGMHRMLGAVIDDVCVAIDNFLASDTTNNPGLDFFISCVEGQDLFGDVFEGAFNGLIDNVGLSNRFGFNIFNNTHIVISTPNRNDTNANGATSAFESALSNTERQLSNFEQRIQNSGLKNNTLVNEVTKVVDTAQLFISILRDVQELLDCSFVRNLFLRLKSLLCDTMLDAIWSLQASEGVMSGAVVVVAFASMLLSKRLGNDFKPYECRHLHCKRRFRFLITRDAHEKLHEIDPESVYMSANPPSCCEYYGCYTHSVHQAEQDGEAVADQLISSMPKELETSVPPRMRKYLKNYQQEVRATRSDSADSDLELHDHLGDDSSSSPSSLTDSMLNRQYTDQDIIEHIRPSDLMFSHTWNDRRNHGFAYYAYVFCACCRGIPAFEKDLETNLCGFTRESFRHGVLGMLEIISVIEVLQGILSLMVPRVMSFQSPVSMITAGLFCIVAVRLFSVRIMVLSALCQGAAAAYLIFLLQGAVEAFDACAGAGTACSFTTDVYVRAYIFALVLNLVIVLLCFVLATFTSFSLHSLHAELIQQQELGVATDRLRHAADNSARSLRQRYQTLRAKKSRRGQNSLQVTDVKKITFAQLRQKFARNNRNNQQRKKSSATPPV